MTAVPEPPSSGQVWISYVKPASLVERYGLPDGLSGVLAGVASSSKRR
jgi:hypothetical protein